VLNLKVSFPYYRKVIEQTLATTRKLGKSEKKALIIGPYD